MMYVDDAPSLRLPSLALLTDAMTLTSVTFPSMYSLSLSPEIFSMSLSPAEWYLCLTLTSMSSSGSKAASLETMNASVEVSLAQFSQMETVLSRDFTWISRTADASWPQDISSSANS